MRIGGKAIAPGSTKVALAVLLLGSMSIVFAPHAQAQLSPFGEQESDGLPMPEAKENVQDQQDESEDSSALPGAKVEPRAPGLQLPSNPAANNPFATAQQAVKSPEQIEADIRKQAFDAALTGLLPLRSEEIRKLLKKYDETRQAVETPVYPYPEAEVVVETISLDPGAKPTVLKLATGHVTSINFLDASGAPWPIAAISWAGNFEIIKPEEGGSGMRISPMSEFAYGNLIVNLLTLKAPVVFTLETRRDKVYYRFDAQIPEYGPLAMPPMIEGGLSISAGNPVLSSILDGIPPQGSTNMAVEGVDGRTSAYLVSGTMYLRTPHTLLSPAWNSSASSADGMNVYALGSAPVVLLSDRGEVVRARVSEKELIDDQQ